MRIKDIITSIENLAPLSLQESYDNSGVQVGDVNKEALGALLCIDVTEEVVDEAISLGCNLIISHHPIAFRPFKSLIGKNYVERCLIKAIKHDIVLYASHTNLDNAFGGVNFKLAKMIGLQNVRVLSPQLGKLMKLVTFVPEHHAETVRSALFNAGAGHVGLYDSCSYNLKGRGSFKANEGANPFVGNIGEVHYEEEIRIETILPKYKKEDVKRALMSVHPYEEPAFDFYSLDNEWNVSGSGIVGTLPEAVDEREFLYTLKDLFKVATLSHSRLRGRDIRDVALCGGSGAFLIPEAIGYGADIFLTGEAKYNDYYDVEDKILLATLGHYETEVCTKNIFFDLLSEKFPNFALYMSGFDVNPVYYL